MNSAAALSAAGHKQLGNEYFQAGRYEDAIREYSTAIIQNPQSIYFTNRALCYQKLLQYDRVIADCEKAIELDENSVKGHYLLGQALTDSSSRLNEAVSSLKKAYNLSIKQNISYTEDIANAFRRAKKRKWEILDARRRENESDLYRYIMGLIDRDRNRQIALLADDEMKEEVDSQIVERKSQVEALFTTAQDISAQRREVPDYFLGKISFDIMVDPVVTPSGITYDRSEIVQHLKKIGETDPISRKPLHEKDLIPNLAMKEAIDDFLDKNGWAVDY